MANIDIEQIRQRLLTRRNVLAERVRTIDKDIHHRDEPISQDFAEQATELEDREVLEALDSEGREELRQIGRALQRLTNGEYDTCEHCGGKIPEKRLAAVPWTSSCIVCATAAEKPRAR